MMLSSLNGKVIIDCLSWSTNPFVHMQLCKVYGARVNQEGDLRIEKPASQDQQDGVSCGLFAVAYMVQLVGEKYRPQPSGIHQGLNACPPSSLPDQPTISTIPFPNEHKSDATTPVCRARPSVVWIYILSCFDSYNTFLFRYY